MRIGTCMLCFAENTTIFDIKNTKLQSVYDDISDSKIQNAIHCLCYICRAKLHQCHVFIKQMLNLHKDPQDDINEIEDKSLVPLTTIKLDNSSFDGVNLPNSVSIKQEPNNYEEENSNYGNEVHLDSNINVKCEVKTEACSSSYSELIPDTTHTETATPARASRAAKVKYMQKVPKIIKEENRYELIKRRERASKRRANESEGQRRKRLDRQSERLANETEVQRKKRLEDMRRRAAERVANETYEERQKRLEDTRRRASERLANETYQQRKKRLADLRRRMSQRIANETKEQRGKRLEKLRCSYKKRKKRNAMRLE